MTVKPSSVLHPVEKLWVKCQYRHEIEQGFAARYLLVGVHATSNPLLCPVNDPVLPVFRLPGVGLEAEHVRPSMSLGDGEADEFLPRKYFGEYFLLKFLRTKVHDRWKTDDQTAHDTCKTLFNPKKTMVSDNTDRRRNHGHRNGRAPER